jgi:hypothetical protein
MKRTGKLLALLGVVAIIAVLSLFLILPVIAADAVPVKLTDTPTPTVPVTPPPPPVIPEASTLILLGGSATGLAAYVGLQIRARRRRP